MGDKIIRILIVLILLVVSGLAGYLFLPELYYRYFPPPAQKTTLDDILTKKSGQMCTFNKESLSGKFYVADGKFKGEFVSSASGEPKTSFVIFDGQNSYLWGENEPSGVKIPYEPKEGDPESQGIPLGTNDSTVIYDYSCGPWRRDESLFVPPADLTFDTPVARQGKTDSDGSILILPSIPPESKI